MKEAYAAEFAATIERAEKQIILARHGRRLLNLLDDTPVVPGDIRPGFEHTNQARQILNDAEDDLRDWTPELEDVPSNASLERNLLPGSNNSPTTARHQRDQTDTVGGSVVGDEESVVGGAGHGHALEKSDSRVSSGGSLTTGRGYSEATAPSVVA